MTTTIRHHLNDALLMAYAAGQLPEAFALVVASHVSLCDDCRARLESFEAVGGALLEETATAPMGAGSLAATMALIGRGPKDPIVPRYRRGAVLPAPLRDYVGGDVDAVVWRPVGNGVRQAILPTARDASARLLHIPPGAAVPHHGHRGLELTLVLQGAFRDGSERFGRGDVDVASEDVQHTPVAETGEPCICLAATDAPLRFSGLLPRLAQPFFRI